MSKILSSLMAILIGIIIWYNYKYFQIKFQKPGKQSLLVRQLIQSSQKAKNFALANRTNAPYIIALGGGMEDFPGNTFYAFNECQKLGIPIIQTDIRKTKDNIFVHIRNKSVSETTNGKGNVHELTYKQIRKMDAGYKFSNDNRSFPFRNKNLIYPELDDTLKKFPDQIFWITLHSQQDEDADKLVELLKNDKNPDRFIVSFSDLNLLQKIKSIKGNIKLAALSGQFLTLKFLSAIKSHYIYSPRESVLIYADFEPISSLHLRNMHEIGLEIWIFERNAGFPNNSMRQDHLNQNIGSIKKKEYIMGHENYLQLKFDGIITKKPKNFIQNR